MVWMVLASSFKIFVQCAIKASLSAGSFLVKAAIQFASASNCWSKKMGRLLISTSRRTMLEVFSIWLPSRLLSLLCRGFCCQFGSIPSQLKYTTSWQVGRKPQEWSRAGTSGSCREVLEAKTEKKLPARHNLVGLPSPGLTLPHPYTRIPVFSPFKSLLSGDFGRKKCWDPNTGISLVYVLLGA